MRGNEWRAVVKSARTRFFKNEVPVRVMLPGFSRTISCICNGIMVVSHVGRIVRNATQEPSSFSRRECRLLHKYKNSKHFFSCAKIGSSQVGGVFMTISFICNGITVVSRVGCILRNATQKCSWFSRVDSVGCFINKKNS